MGRPSKYTKVVAERICIRLMEGQSLRTICTDEAMPAQSTVYRWLAQNAGFQEQYARAREVQADTLADETIDIADDTASDSIKTEDGERPNTEWIARSRLRVDTRKWVASKLAPKKYGDKVEQTIQGPGGGPIEVRGRSLDDFYEGIGVPAKSSAE